MQTTKEYLSLVINLITVSVHYIKYDFNYDITSSANLTQGWVIEGFPRTREQVSFLVFLFRYPWYVLY